MTVPALLTVSLVGAALAGCGSAQHTTASAPGATLSASHSTPQARPRSSTHRGHPRTHAPSTHHQQTGATAKPTHPKPYPPNTRAPGSKTKPKMVVTHVQGSATLCQIHISASASAPGMPGVVTSGPVSCKAANQLAQAVGR